MKTTVIIVLILAVAFLVWLSLRNRVGAIIVPTGEMDVDNPPTSITFKYDDILSNVIDKITGSKGKEYKYAGPKDKFTSNGKDYPLYFVFGDASSKNIALGSPKTIQKPTCVIGEDVPMGNDKYVYYMGDEKWCLYKKKS